MPAERYLQHRHAHHSGASVIESLHESNIFEARQLRGRDQQPRAATAEPSQFDRYFGILPHSLSYHGSTVFQLPQVLSHRIGQLSLAGIQSRPIATAQSAAEQNMMVLREVTERRPVNDFRDIGYRVDVPTAINLTWKLLAIVEMWRCCIWSHALITPLQQKRKSITEYVDAMPFP